MQTYRDTLTTSIMKYYWNSKNVASVTEEPLGCADNGYRQESSKMGNTAVQKKVLRREGLSVRY